MCMLILYVYNPFFVSLAQPTSYPARYTLRVVPDAELVPEKGSDDHTGITPAPATPTFTKGLARYKAYTWT